MMVKSSFRRLLEKVNASSGKGINVSAVPGDSKGTFEDQAVQCNGPVDAASSRDCSSTRSVTSSSTGSVVMVDDFEFFDTVQHHLQEETKMAHSYNSYQPSDSDNYKSKEGDDSTAISLIATSTTTSSTAASSTRKFVRFHRIEIREYGVTLGDHPGPRVGPSVTIEWQHQAELVVDLNQYERIFSGVGSSAKFRRRKGEELRMPPEVRERMLLASHGGVKGMQREATLLRLQQLGYLHPQDLQQQHGCGVRLRCRSARAVARLIGRGCLLGLICWNERLEEALQSAVRKIKRWKQRRKGTKPEPAELWIETYIPKEIIFF